MEKILEQMEAALLAEKNQTSALNTCKALFGSLKDRWAEHAKLTAPGTATVPVAPASQAPPVKESPAAKPEK